ncbi:hypothetical protein SCHPADRAFT_941288 [Schizopora paradoxa]|uniref:NYN domain-containing protein n=1 Tax=Schizopora paradoxa TaxID=27342 RepID=A0A0H2RK47_9AGAM|nr:hypothetical protein SCHPADRAFT_941288 [Schizopora paradoxa]
MSARLRQYKLTSTSVPTMVEKVGIFWDLKGCQPSSPPTTCKFANAIRTIAAQYGSVTTFKAYSDETLEDPKTKALQVPLCASGVTMVHCPTFFVREDVVLTLTVDMMAFAFDLQAPATIVVITHRIFTYALSTLRMRGFRIVSIMPENNMPDQISDNVDVVISWENVLEKSQLSERPDVRPGLEFDSSEDARAFAEIHQPEPSPKYETTVQEPEDVFVERGLSIASTSALSSKMHHSPQVTSPISNTDQSSLSLREEHEGFPEQFITLYNLLRELSPSSASGRVQLSILGGAVKKHDPGLYKQMGFTRLLPYLEHAKSVGIIVLGSGGQTGTEWVQWVGPHPATELTGNASDFVKVA